MAARPWVIVALLSVAAASFPFVHLVGGQEEEPKPDLVIASLTMTPEEPPAREEVTFDVVVANDGAGNATTFAVSLEIDDEVVGDEDVDELFAGENTTVTFHWHATPGNHTAIARADAQGDVSEEDETNNQRGFTFSVPREHGPDIVVTALTWDPERPPREVDVVLNATVVNQGDEASDPFLVRFLVDDEPIGADIEVDALEPGENVTVESDPWESTFGNHELTVQADVPAFLTGAENNETDESNNNLTRELAIGPDLLVANVTWTETNGTVNVTASIANEGTENASNFTVRFLVDNATEVANLSVDTLAAEATLDLTNVTWQRTEGNHTLLVLADSGEAVNETNEANNERLEDLARGPLLPDVDVTALNVVGDLVSGASLRFVANVTNNDTMAVLNITVAFVLDDDVDLGSARIARLAPDESVDVRSLRWTASSGTHQVGARVGVNGTFRDASAPDRAITFDVEPRENVPGEVRKLPNLRVASINVPPVTQVGTNLTVNATIENVGEAPAGPFQVRFLYDGQIVLAETSIDALDAGRELRVASPPLTAERGIHIVSVVADSLDQVNESNETDNTRWRALGVAEPDDDGVSLPGTNATGELSHVGTDAALVSVRWEPAAPKAGDEVTFTALVQNDGATDLAEIQVTFSVGGEPIGDGRLDALEARLPAEVTSPPWNAVEGKHDLRAVLDPAGLIDEDDETDNEWTGTIDVQGDALVPDVSFLLVGVLVASGAVLTRSWRQRL